MKTVPFIFNILFFILPLQLKAISFSVHTELRDSMLYLLKNNQIDAANTLLEQGLSTALEQDNLLNYFDLIKKAGSFWRKSNTPERCIAIYKKGEQESLCRLPNRQDEWKSLAWLYVQLGKAYDRKIGDFQSAQLAYEKAASIFDSNLFEVNPNHVARFVFQPLGNIHTRSGDFHAGATYLNSFIQQMILDEDTGRATAGYSDLALLMENWGKLKKARAYYFTGLNLPNNDGLSRIILLLNLGSFYTKQDSLDSSLKYLREANTALIIEQHKDNHHPRVINLLGVVQSKLAEAYQAAKKYEQTLTALQKTIVYYQAYYDNTQRREFGKIYNQLGSFFHETADYGKAIKNYQISLQNVLYDYQPKNELVLPAAASLYAENTIWEALEGMAASYQAWYKIKGHTLLLKKALACYDLINEVEIHLRRSYMYEDSKLFNLEESLINSEKAIILAHQLYEITNDADFLYQAFNVVERNRSSLLREAIRNSQAINKLGLSEQALQMEKNLAYQISKAQEEQFYLKEQQASDSLIHAADQALLAAKDAERNWRKELENKHPRYYQLKYADDLPSLEQYQSMLSSDQLLIEYFVGKDQLYVFTIDKKGLSLKLLPLPKNLTKNILAWRKSIEDYQYVDADQTTLMAQYLQIGHQLYKELLHPILMQQRVDNLLIIPGGILDLLPFEALLQTPSNLAVALNDLPYLLQNYTITYCYSASLYYALAQLERSGKGMGGFAPDFSNSTNWSRLDCSKNLLESLDDSWEKELSLGRSATIKRFREMAGNYQLLHLATHAQANTAFGNFSFIVFHNEQGGYDSLFVKDLYLEDIKAELIILSACETALGTLYNSEGVISLARAFHYVGARSVVTTSWQINEGANCSLMTSFYKELAIHQDKATALRTAKLNYLKTADLRAAHPVFWAGVQLSGNPRPLSEPENYLAYLLGSTLLILFGIVRLKK